MNVRRGQYLVPLLAGSLLLGACESSSLGADGNARLSVQLTDAPGDLKQVFVKVNRIVLKGAVAGDTAANPQEFTVSNQSWIDLVTLSGGNVATLLSDASIKPGTYSQVRFVLGGAYIVTDDGKVYATRDAAVPAGTTVTGELKCPSCSSSGLKVKLGGGGVAVGEGSNVLLLDFDVKQSFGHEAGNSGKYVLNPVIVGVKKSGSGNSGTGKISGSVGVAAALAVPSACGGVTGAVNLLSKFVPTASGSVGGEAVVRSGSVSSVTATGASYTIGNLAAGTYALGVDKVGFANGDSLTFTVTSSAPSVTVTTGATAQSNYTISGVTCKAKTS